jgi:hypothetical protein
MVGMWLYNRRWWKPRWKDTRTSNVETQTHGNVGKLGIREGIGPGWPCRFKLDALDGWQQCQWQINPWKVNWHPQMRQEALAGGCKHVKRVGVGRGVWSWAIIRVDIMEGGKGPTCALFRGIGKMLCWGSTFTWRPRGWWGELMGGMGGWRVVGIGKLVENGVMVVC